MYYITVIFVPLGSIMVGYFVAKDLNVVSLILSVIILLMNIVILYLYDNLVNMFSQQYETDVIEQQNKAYLNQLHLMQESQMKIRFLKHDMKIILSTCKVCLVLRNTISLKITLLKPMIIFIVIMLLSTQEMKRSTVFWITNWQR